jgi:hypothetical protein
LFFEEEEEEERDAHILKISALKILDAWWSKEIIWVK